MKTIADWIYDIITAKVSLNEGLEKMAKILENDILNEVIKELNNMINNEKTALVVVDVQNDFVNGALGSPEAEAIVPLVCEYIQNFKGKYIAVTQDCHSEKGYEEYIEGQRIPFHCGMGTDGIELNADVEKALEEKIKDGTHINWFYKNTFGSTALAKEMLGVIRKEKIETIIIIGLCTDICVISNALILRASFPWTRIVVLEDLCAGSSPANHQAALEIMSANCIDIWSYHN